MHRLVNPPLLLSSASSRSALASQSRRLGLAFLTVLQANAESRVASSELWASSFEAHKHPPKGADYVICWENDWEGRPSKFQHLKIISLKRHVGALPRVFVVACRPDNAPELSSNRVEWNVPRKAQPGDLVLIYRTAPTAAIHDAWKITGPYNYYTRRNKERRFPGMQAELCRIAKFENPITLAALQNDLRTRDLPIMKKRFVGKSEITSYWPVLHKKIVQLNRASAPALRPFIGSDGD